MLNNTKLGKRAKRTSPRKYKYKTYSKVRQAARTGYVTNSISPSHYQDTSSSGFYSGLLWGRPTILSKMNVFNIHSIIEASPANIAICDIPDQVNSVTCTVCKKILCPLGEPSGKARFYAQIISEYTGFQSAKYGNVIRCFCNAEEAALFEINPLAYE